MDKQEYLQHLYDLAKAVWYKGGSRAANSLVGKLSAVIRLNMAEATERYKTINNPAIDDLVSLINTKGGYELSSTEDAVLKGMLVMLNR